MHTPLLSIRNSIEESAGFVKGIVVSVQQNDFPSKKTSEKNSKRGILGKKFRNRFNAD